MTFAFVAATAALLLSGSATAEDQADQRFSPGEGDLSVGIGIICNTHQQLERYVGLLSGGAETQGAVRKVNDEAKDARACGVAVIAFQSDKTVQIKNMRGRMVSLVRISIVAAFDGQQWRAIPGLVQYALVEPEGLEI